MADRSDRRDAFHADAPREARSRGAGERRRATDADVDPAIRQRWRRLALETRTLTMTLRSALDDLEEEPTLTVAERIRLRREWIEGVGLMVQGIRARSMQLEALVRSTDAPSDPTEVADHPHAALRRAEEYLEELRRDESAWAEDA
jgi:hypothetical protein